jgi:hypothetical protein
MNTVLRSIALTLGASASLAACGNNSKSVGDVLAEDSTLAREVLSARGDTLAQPIDTAIPDSAAAVEVADADIPEAQAGPADTPLTVRSAVAETGHSAPQASSRISAPVVRSTSSPSRTISRSSRVARSRSNSVSARVSRTAPSQNRQRTTVEATPMRGSATIPAGRELALASDQRVCASMSRVGDTFDAHVAEDVVGPIGVVIPKGAIAHARVVANKGDVDIDIESLSFAQHDYSVESLVTYTEMVKVGYKSHRATRNAATGAGLGAVVGGVAGRDIKSAVIGAAGGAVAGVLASRSTGSTKRDQCIPAGGEITARLVAPLKVALID